MKTRMTPPWSISDDSPCPPARVWRPGGILLAACLVAAITHLHAFVREARLTEPEFHQLCAALARAGQRTTASHNEVVLGAGSLGVSALVCLQNNAEAQPIIEAIAADNADAVIHESPGMVKIDCPGRLVIRRTSIEARIGRDFDLQELHLNLISLGGNIDEDDDEFVLSWQR